MVVLGLVMAAIPFVVQVESLGSCFVSSVVMSSVFVVVVFILLVNFAFCLLFLVFFCPFFPSVASMQLFKVHVSLHCCHFESLGVVLCLFVFIIASVCSSLFIHVVSLTCFSCLSDLFHSSRSLQVSLSDRSSAPDTEP